MSRARRLTLRARAATATLVALACGVAAAAGAQSAPPGGRAPVAPPDTSATTTVSYISGGAVYVAAGRIDGIREGMALAVVRADSTIAVLRATFLSSRSASCELVSGAMPVVGDRVRYVRITDAPPAPGAARGATDRAPATRRASARLRGQVGVRYLDVRQLGDAPGGVAQPAADVRVNGARIGDTPFGVALDARGRRTVATRRDARGESTSRTHVYQAAAFVEFDRTRTRLAVGRQYSTALAPVSLFDGVAAEVGGQHWTLGGLTGTQPAPVTLGFSGAVREHGVYAQAHSRPRSGAPWAVTVGGIASYDAGELNREFVFLQASTSTPAVSVSAAQELDVNRGWKRDAGEPALSLTSTFASLSVRVSPHATLQGGFDNRRNVRLHRDYVDPETEFDDRYRRGAWAGAALRLRAVRLGGDWRTNRGGGAGTADVYTGTVAVERLTRLHAHVRTRTTRFRTAMTTGTLYSGNVGIEPASSVRLELNGGVRTERSVATGSLPATTGAAGPTVRRTTWLGADCDLSLGRHWYLLVSTNRERGDLDGTQEFYGSLVFRF